MCTHQKYVYNKYINKRLLVSCGKCPACQQAKANLRATRIRNHNFCSDLCFFITLTYDNKYVPYVETSQLVNVRDCEFSDVSVPIYRDCDFRYYKGKSFVNFNKSIIGTISKSDIKPFCYDVPQISKKPHCTSVIVWSDVQKFIKRLRINLKRELGFDKKITYFAVGEYGGKTFRCHFHLLLYFPEGTYETLRPIISKSWPYGDMLRKNKRIQLAIDASSYLAAYLNKSEGFPLVLESSAIRQKHSHSFHFGVGQDCFSLPSLLEKADYSDMSYYREVFDNGIPRLVSLPIPEYVINRWFPRFKGYSSFAPDAILQLLRFYQQYWYKLGCLDEYKIDFSSWFDDGSLGLLGLPKYLYVKSSSRLIAPELLVSPKDFRVFVIRLSHAFGVYHEITGKNIFDYAIDYQRVWLSRWSYCFKHSFDDIKDISDFSNFYDNANVFVDRPCIAPSLPSPDRLKYTIDPNERFSIIQKDNRLLKQWNFKRQTREINAEVLSSIDEEF